MLFIMSMISAIMESSLKIAAFSPENTKEQNAFTFVILHDV